jgi:ketosteroid isomerase-like protein
VNGPTSNAELVQRLLSAYLGDDEDTLREMIGPQGEILGAAGIINAGTYYGYDGFRKWVQQWEEAWAEASYELGETVDVSDSLVVLPVRIIARGTGSGAQVDMIFGWLFEWDQGRVERFHAYMTVDEALEVARELASR